MPFKQLDVSVGPMRVGAPASRWALPGARRVWADTLLALERAHLLRLTAWGAVSIATGSALLAWRMARRSTDPAVLQFAVQCVAWGAIVLLFAVLGWSALAPRDMDSALRLTNRLWLNTGLAVGYTAVGLTLAICGWRLGRRPGLVGAGTAVVAQGLALLALELQFISSLSLG